MGKDPGEAKITLQKSEELLATGLTLEVLVALGREFQARGMDPKSAPAEIAEAVRRCGSLKEEELTLEGKVSSLRAEFAELTEEVKENHEKAKTLRQRCVDLARDEAKLRKHYHCAIQEYRQIEQRHQTTMCNLTKETEQKCEQMVKKARKQVQEAKKELVISKENTLRWRAEAEKHKTEIASAKALFNFPAKGEPAKFSELKALYDEDQPYGNLPLPESVRGHLAQSFACLLTEDARERLRIAEQTAKQKAQFAEEYLRKAFKIYKQAEEKQNTLATLEFANSARLDILETAILALLNEPTLLARFLRKVQGSHLLKAFMSLPNQTRAFLRQLLEVANAKAEEEDEGKFDEWLRAQMVRELRTAMNQASPYVLPPI